jgi:SAM-dependent methyltransferase
VAVYDALAEYYDAVTGDSASESAFVDRVIRKAHAHPETVLEIACGTGEIIASLAGRYKVSGLDISPGMLAVARKKLPAEVPLYLADMSSFELHAQFDAVICVYHGINHLADFPSWQSLFGCVHRHLNEGGVFTFDTYTPGGLMTMAAGPQIVQGFGGGREVRITVRAGGQAVFDWDVEVFALRQGARKRLLREVIKITAFPAERIREALSERFAGITAVETGDGGADTRIWFTCTKPAAAASAES